jgi:hypothetical protein
MKLTLKMLKNSILNEEVRKKEKKDNDTSYNASVAGFHDKIMKHVAQVRFQQSKNQKI